MRLPSRVRQARRFTRRSLALANAPAPWHRGIVMVVTIVLAVAIGVYSGESWVVTVAPAFALFLCIADLDGPLALRLSMLGWSTSLLAVGVLLALTLNSDETVFATVFVILAFIAGLASWAGAPFMTATRFSVIAGLLMHSVANISLVPALGLLVGVAAIVAAARGIESLLAPDKALGEYVTFRGAYFKMRAARPLLWRYATVYALVVVVGWALGRTVDTVHPTWVTVSTLVTMWPDAARSYERIVQRFFGTIAGALVTLGLLAVVHDPYTLSAIALLMAFFLPHFLRRNYWLYSALIVVLVMVAVDVSSKTGFTRHVVTDRIVDVMLGCVFALVGTILAFGRAHRLARARAQHP